jgi:transposase
MLKPEIQTTLVTLFLQGKSLREITSDLNISRNTVRRVVRQELTKSGQGSPGAPQPQLQASMSQVSAGLDELFARAKGNVVRVQELLQSERGETVPYSTLTRWIREADLRPAPRRVGEFVRAAGEETQHDTSPHKVVIGGKTIVAQCASLVLAYSRRLYVQYYPRFTRLEAKHFLLEASHFMQGTCPRCVIDNTSVILAGGSGKNAIVAPEMAAFARTLGFEFMAHEVNDPDRKGRVERPFHWVENNFIPGRTFVNFADLNAQALQWCVNVANAKPKKVLGMSPDAAYVLERQHLQPLPTVQPPVFDVLERVVDASAFVSIETNRYSVPERFIGKAVTVYRYPGELQIFHRNQMIATHARILDRRDVKQTLPGHHQQLQRVVREPPVEESVLRSAHPLLDQYVSELTRRDRYCRPVQPRRVLKRLLEIQRTYPRESFLAAIEQALRFGLFDLGRLEALVLKYVSGDFFRLDDDNQGDDNAS